MNEGAALTADSSAGKRANASAVGRASTTRSTTKPASAKALITATSGRRQKMLSHLHATLVPCVADEFGVEVPARLAQKRRPEGMIEGDDHPAARRQRSSERS